MSEKLLPLELTPEQVDDYYNRINVDKFTLKQAREDPVIFSRFMINFTPRDYQAYIMDEISNNQHTGIVKGRQIGFSTTIALYCLWYAWFGKAKTGANKNTKICIISKDDDAAKKLLQQIKDFMYMGDVHMSKLFKSKKEHTQNYFSREIVVNNVDMLKLKGGSIITSFPPTGKIRGTSNDLVFIDEFAFVNNTDVDSFFYTEVMPTISETNGKTIISSTPNGYGGLFYELIDPDGKKQDHVYKRTMVPFSCNNNNPDYMTQVDQLRSHMDEGKFRQEYECDFVSADERFFNAKRVKEMFDDSLNVDMDEHEFIVGVDYGMTQARTVVAMATIIKDNVVVPYFKEFAAGHDVNEIVGFIDGLKDRFKINKIVVDHCPQGDGPNKKMLSMGWNVELFEFGKQKIEAYCVFRSKMNKIPACEIKVKADKNAEKQFLEMIQEESKMGKLQIHKPRSGRDDIPDAIIMACYTLLQNKHRVGAYLA